MRTLLLLGAASVCAASAFTLWTKNALIRQDRRLARASLSELQTLARAAPDGHVFYFLGRRLEDAGQDAAAFDALNRAVSLSPDDGRAHLALAEFFLKNHAAERAFAEASRAAALAPNDVAAWRVAGISAATNHPAEAEVALRRAIEIAPDDWHNSANLGDLLTGLARPDDALPFCRDAVRRAPDDGLAALSLGRALLKASAKNPALLPECHRVLSRSFTLRPDIPMTRLLLGECCARQNLWPQARQFLTSASRQMPTSAEAIYELSKADAHLGLTAEAAEATAAHRRLLEYQSEKRTLLETLTSPKNGGESVRLKLAKLLTAGGEFQEAERQYQQAARQADALRAGGNDEAALRIYLPLARQNPRNAAALQGAGLSLARRGNLALGVPFLLEATRLQPNLPQAQQILGQVYLDAGFRGEAERRARLAATLDGENADAWHLLGLSLRDVETAQKEARDAFARAVALNPNDAQYRLDLGDAQASSGQGNAAEAYQQALRLAPKNVDVQARVGAFWAIPRAGESDTEKSERQREARRLLHAALAANPADGFVNYALGRLEIAGGDGETGLRFLETAVLDKSVPNPADIWYALSRAAARVGKSKKAADALARSRRLRQEYAASVVTAEQAARRPRDSGLRLQMARAYAASGQWAWAIRAYEDCLKMSPMPPAAPKELNALKTRLTQAKQMPSMPLFNALLAASNS